MSMLIRSIFTFLFRYSFPQQTRVREANVLLWRGEKVLMTTMHSIMPLMLSTVARGSLILQCLSLRKISLRFRYWISNMFA